MSTNFDAAWRQAKRQMKKRVTPEAVRAMIETRIEKAGGVRALAREMGISPAHVSDVRLGRRDFGGALLHKYFGVRKRIVRTVTYVMVGRSAQENTSSSRRHGLQCRVHRESLR